MSDLLPSGLDLISSSTTQGTLMTSGSTIIADVGTLTSGQIETVTLDVSSTESGTFVNTAFVTGNEEDPDTSNNSSTATVTVADAAAAPLTVTQVKIKFNFKQPGKDQIIVGGELPIEAGFNVAGQVLSIDIGGTTKTFTLDEKGKAKVGQDQVNLHVKSKKGVVSAQDAKFKVILRKGDFLANYADEGMTDENTSNEPVTVLITVDLGGDLHQAFVDLLYKANAGKTGLAKQ